MTMRRIALGLVWLAVASGAVVFSEPAPADVLTMGLVIGLPLVGLVAPKGPLCLVTAIWGVCGAGALIASSFAPDIAKSATHTAISLYLYLAFFTYAGFVAKRPVAHTRLILSAYLCAALVGAAAGIVGYFNLYPGAFELLTRYGRATGTFKDANVFGPFLVPALLYTLHRALNAGMRRAIFPAIMLLFFSFAILLSFSRGAWFNATVAVVVYAYFSFVFAPGNRQRIKMILLGTLVLAAAIAMLVAAAHHDAIADLLSDRAALTQSYDEGPQGRFGGHEKAKGLILENPLGLGALVFASHYHHEDVHNVYLTLFLSAGWVGGLAFAAIVWLTALWGGRHAMRRTPHQALFLIVYAAFLGNALEGFVIDIDHWRHFYLEMGIIWGLMVADRRAEDVLAATHHFAPRRRRVGRRPGGLASAAT